MPYLDPAFPSHGPFSKTGFIGIPLSTLREMATSAIPNIAAVGGILASDTTPIFNTFNADTDSAQHLSWVANGVHPVGFQTPLPPNFDFSQPLYVHILAEMSGSTPWDTCTVAADTFFDVGDTKVEDTVAITGGTVVDWTLTIAAADIPFLAKTVSIELTPGAHANDALYVFAIWLEFGTL